MRLGGAAAAPMAAERPPQRDFAGRSRPESKLVANVSFAGRPFYEGQWGQLIFLAVGFAPAGPCFSRIALLPMIDAPSDSGAKAVIIGEARRNRAFGAACTAHTH